MKTYLLSCLLVLAGALGYLAYENDQQAKRQKLALTRLQNAAKKANQEADYLLQRLENRDEGELLAMLQKMRPTIGIADAAGKFIDISQTVSQYSDLHFRVVMDSILETRFPHEFQYEIGDHYFHSAEGAYRALGWRGAGEKIKFYRTARLYPSIIGEVFGIAHYGKNGKRRPIAPANPPILLIMR